MHSNNIINDPNYVPLAVDSQGVLFCTEDGTIIIASSTLKVRRQYGNPGWLRTPVRLTRGKK